MQQYLNLLEKILTEGHKKGDRTGTGTLSIFGHQMRFPLEQGFPLVTTKKVPIKPIIHELLWFLRGDTNIAYLRQNGVHIWDHWANENGDLGPVYGRQWRSWPASRKEWGDPIDQIQAVVKQIQTTQNSRRMVVSTWNVADLPDERLSPQDNVAQGKMALAPCHVLFQFYVSPGSRPTRETPEVKETPGKLSCQVYQRSGDTFLGVPFNIASYALLTHLIAEQAGLLVGDLVWTGGDVHLYLNHLEQARLQLSREPFPSPTLRILRSAGCVPSLFDYTYEDFKLENYQSHEHIPASISI